MSATTVLALPTGAFTIDTAHSGIHFQVRHLGLSNVRGLFKEFRARLTVGDSLEDVAVQAEVDLSSIDTNQADRDAHLLSTDFFNADANPTMTFRSTSVAQTGPQEYQMSGDLTINGVTGVIAFDVEFNGTEVHPADQSTRAGFSATGEVRRSDFGIDFNIPLDGGGFVIGDKIKLFLEVEAVLQP